MHSCTRYLDFVNEEHSFKILQSAIKHKTNLERDFLAQDRHRRLFEIFREAPDFHAYDILSENLNRTEKAKQNKIETSSNY